MGADNLACPDGRNDGKQNNRLKIEIKMTAHSTTANPITDNSQLYASVKESASQLGLNFTDE